MGDMGGGGMGSRGGPAGPPTDETADLLALRKKLLEKKRRLDQMLRQSGGGTPTASTGGKNGGGRGSQRYVFSSATREISIARSRRARFPERGRIAFPPLRRTPPRPVTDQSPFSPFSSIHRQQGARARGPLRWYAWSPRRASSRPSLTTVGSAPSRRARAASARTYASFCPK